MHSFLRTSFATTALSGTSLKLGTRVTFGALLVALLGLLGGFASGAQGQGSHHDYVASEENLTLPAEMLEGLDFRSLEFSRGGRSTAATGVPGEPLTYYFGGTGGGVFKTTDAGTTWTNVTDGFLGVGSVGAISVAPSDPNVVYIGTGSACPRGNISNGDGIYRSSDAGKTWDRIGLEASGQIGRMHVHPENSDLLYVAALGNLFGPNEERGIFRSKDGGNSWEKVLFISKNTGFADLAMDRNNPRVLYAAAWRAERKPWSLISGSEEGGLYKTTDGGDTWNKLEGGLPGGLVGKIGVTVSPANSNRVWALVEAEGELGGVYRSDDAGESWTRINGDAKLRQRPWYYHHIYADPQNEDTVYALNTGFYKSTDGGKTFPKQIQVPHGDNHDLWLNPENPLNMINANDGGANVSFNGGDSWSWQMNQETAEFYRVFVDNQWPYRVYGPQQDNSTISVPSQGFVAWNRIPPDWYDVGGCESGHIAIDPRNPDVTYAGCYGGSITRTDRSTGVRREIIAYPQLQLGQAARDLKYRFQWNAPIRISPHDPDVVYHTSQVVHRTRNAGQTWDVISPDLTTNDKEQQDYAGGPISRDSTGVEIYNVIFAFEESQHRQGELWAGSDDGRVHVSRNNGETWEEVTPSGMPNGGTVNTVQISNHDPDRIHLAVYKYRENDFKPYIFQTDNGGRSWKLLTNGLNGIPETNFVRSIVEDPVRKGLLFAGTEFGLYISFDDGSHWQRFQNNLPVTPVTDLVIHRDDLVMATQGRSFWMLEDLSVLRQIAEKDAQESFKLYEPRVTYRGGGSANLAFFVPELPEESATLEILQGDDVLVDFEWKPDAAQEGGPELPAFLRRFMGAKLEIKEGLNRFAWNLREKAPEAPKGVIHWGFTPGITVVPGTYTARLTIGDEVQEQPVEVEAWPTLKATQEDYQKQYDLGQTIYSQLDAIYTSINDIRDVKTQVDATQARFKKAGLEDEELTEAAKELKDSLSAVEEKLTQVKSKSRQDPLNFPPQIDNQYVELYAYVVAADSEPPDAAYLRLEHLDADLKGILNDVETAMGGVDSFNSLVKTKEVPAIVLKKD